MLQRRSHTRGVAESRDLHAVQVGRYVPVVGGWFQVSAIRGPQPDGPRIAGAHRLPPRDGLFHREVDSHPVRMSFHQRQRASRPQDAVSLPNGALEHAPVHHRRHDQAAHHRVDAGAWSARVIEALHGGLSAEMRKPTVGTRSGDTRDLVLRTFVGVDHADDRTRGGAGPGADRSHRGVTLMGCRRTPVW